MPERKSGPELPSAKRYELFPVLEDEELLSAPAALGSNEALQHQLAVREFVQATGGEEGEVEANPKLRGLADMYFHMLESRRLLKARIRSLESAQKTAAATGIAELSNLFDSPRVDPGSELAELRENLAFLEKNFEGARDGMRLAYRDIKEPGAAPPLAGTSEREMLFELVKFGDAARRYSAYARDQREIVALERKAALYEDLVRLRQSAEDMVLATPENAEAPRLEVREVLDIHLKPEIERIVDQMLDNGFPQKPKEMKENVFRQTLLDHVLNVELSYPARYMNGLLRARTDEVARRKRGWDEALRDARNSDLAELVREREVQALLKCYHIEKKRFIPVGEIKEELESLDRIVSSPRGPILRALLYGPPGTGKTESLREIAARNKQKVRVISLHENSVFESLIGMNQIPIPKASSLADAERFWTRLENARGTDFSDLVPGAILDQFSGENTAARGADFKKWFEHKLRAARAVAALGAVAPDDPRVRKAEQEALAAWLDQPLAEGLQQGDIIILDEADRAGNALEGLQDLLTRRPGDRFQPPGRPEPFRIHPRARVVMTANWGDIQTEFTAGGGRLAAPIVSRVVEKRKIDYLLPETELKLFEIMTSTPEGRSLLRGQEHKMAEILISKVFPKLRDLYLRPGELQFVSPISVRTLENIARRIIDETTRSRVRDSSGQPEHFIEAAWNEIAGGPFREDQRERIIKEIAKIFNDAGMFEELSTIEAPRHLQVAYLTGLPETTVGAFMGVQSVTAGFGAATAIPKGFSFGTQLAYYQPARNEALLAPLTYASPRAHKLEAERARRRAIEDRGGNVEVQDALARLLPDWEIERNKWMQENVDEDVLLSKDVIYLSPQINKLEPSAGDIELLQATIADLRQSYRYYARSGLLLSLVINRYREARLIRHPGMVGTDEKFFDVILDLTKTPSLELLGYRQRAGSLTLIGEAGDELGREAMGGRIDFEVAGDRCGYRLSGAHLEGHRVGNRAGQRMKLGFLSADQAGNRAALGMEGGRMQIGRAGDRAGTRMKGGSLEIQLPGNRLGEEMETEAVILITEDFSIDSESLGSNVRGTIKNTKTGEIIIEKGVKPIRVPSEL